MGAAAAAPLFLLNLDKGLSVAYNDSQAKLATKKGYAMNGCATIRLYKPTKYDSRLRRYEKDFRSSSFVLRSSSFVLRFSSLVLMKMSAQICAYIFTNYHEHFV